MTENAVLEVCDLRAGYGPIEVLHGVSLSVHSGAIEVLLGRNGVGKTTLLHAISGLVRIRGGQLRLAERDISRAPAHRRAAAGIALVQEGKQIFRERTVYENVLLGTYRRDLTRTERNQACNEVLASFPSLTGREHARAGGLSGGQQQMVAIAQAIASKPSVLMLDEPSAGLAPSIVAELLEHVVSLRNAGLGVLLVEQLAHEALSIADHVTVMNDGLIDASGAPALFANAQELHRAYLGAA